MCTRRCVHGDKREGRWQLTAIVVGEGAAALAGDGAGVRCGDARCVCAPVAVGLMISALRSQAGACPPGDHHVGPGRVILARCRLRNLTCRSVVARAGAIAGERANAVRANSTVETRVVPPCRVATVVREQHESEL